MISVICVYNNKAQFEAQLKKSLNQQNTDYELIALDNCDNKFKSAAQALNYGAGKSKGDILIFSHQDIYFKAENELKELADSIASCEAGSVIGVQGVIDNSNTYYSNITAGEAFNSDFCNDYEKALYEVSCVDEGLFGMKKSTWQIHNFDEELCYNWHLYAVEQCLYARSNNYKVYVYPSQVHHFSYGKISLSYMLNLKKLCKFYRDSFKYIWTTCYKVKTNPIYINTLIFIWTVNRIVKRKPLN